MEQHLDAPLTLDSIARELCVSRTRLAAVYKAETGRGVAEDLRRLRMDRASDLLAGTDMPLAEIGRAVGYPRPSSFTTAFTREQGCSAAHLAQALPLLVRPRVVARRSLVQRRPSPRRRGRLSSRNRLYSRGLPMPSTSWISSSREPTSSLRYMLRTCVRTVCSEMHSTSAT